MIEQAQKELQKLRWVILFLIFILKLEVESEPLFPPPTPSYTKACVYAAAVIIGKKDPVITIDKESDPAFPKWLHS